MVLFLMRKLLQEAPHGDIERRFRDVNITVSRQKPAETAHDSAVIVFVRDTRLL